jgi:hypothetical protein
MTGDAEKVQSKAFQASAQKPVNRPEWYILLIYTKSNFEIFHHAQTRHRETLPEWP